MSIQDAIEKAKQAVHPRPPAAAAAAPAVPAGEAKAKSSVPRARFIRATSAQQPVYPGTTFQHTFRVVNSGDEAWPALCHVRCTGGTPDTRAYADAKIYVGPIQPGQEVDILLDLQAPTNPGRHVTYWRLCGEDNLRFGDRFWVDMTVQDLPPRPRVPSYEDAIGHAAPAVAAEYKDQGAATAATASAAASAVASTAAPAPAPSVTLSVDNLTDWVAVSKDMQTSMTSSVGSQPKAAPVQEPAHEPAQEEAQEPTQEPVQEEEPVVRDPKHAQLIAMGFDAGAALAALTATNGDTVAAIAHLTSLQ